MVSSRSLLNIPYVSTGELYRESGSCRFLERTTQAELAYVLRISITLVIDIRTILPWIAGRALPCQPCKIGAGQAFSIVHNNGCWCVRENSLTWVTLVSATSRVKTPHTPLPRVCTCSMTCV